MYLEEIWGVSNSFMAMEATAAPFKYPDTLVDKVKVLSWEVMENNEALASSQTSLSKVEASLNEENLSLDPY